MIVKRQSPSEIPNGIIPKSDLSTIDKIDKEISESLRIIIGRNGNVVNLEKKKIDVENGIVSADPALSSDVQPINLRPKYDYTTISGIDKAIVMEKNFAQGRKDYIEYLNNKKSTLQTQSTPIVPSSINNEQTSISNGIELSSTSQILIAVSVLAFAVILAIIVYKKWYKRKIHVDKQVGLARNHTLAREYLPSQSSQDATTVYRRDMDSMASSYYFMNTAIDIDRFHSKTFSQPF